ncbi:MAG: T9SS type A sorting domain-containing protein [Bacteroidota bacterium]
MQLKKYNLLIVSILLIFTSISLAQNVLKLKPFDGTPATYLVAQIKADTAANKGILATRIYELEAGRVYLNTEIFNVSSKVTLRIRGASGDKKPIIYQHPTGTGSSPQNPPGNLFVLVGGSLEMSNIAVSGYFELMPEQLNNVQGGLINTTGAGSTIIVDRCIFNNINGQHIRTGSATVKIKVTNTIFANMGALSTSNLGAGKGLDLREASCDSLVLVNNTFVNYLDRPIRHYNFSNPLAGTGGIKFALIDHNSFINGMGFHGLLSLGNVGRSIVIRNNLFVDGFASGADPTDATRAAEWANTGEKLPNGLNRMMWIFTAPNDTTKWIVKNNVYSISSAGQKFFDDHKAVPITEGSPLSWHINRRLGADSTKAFSKTSVTLSNIPALMTNLMRWYLDPLGGNKTKNTPSSLWIAALHDMDRKPITYYRDEFNASFATTNPAYTAAEKGFPVGDLNWFPTKKTEWEKAGGTDLVASAAIPTEFSLQQNYPNPFNPTTRITFNLPKNSMVNLSVYNILGEKVATVVNQELTAGVHAYNFDGSILSSGAYFYKLNVNQVSLTKKMMLVK